MRTRLRILVPVYLDNDRQLQAQNTCGGDWLLVTGTGGRLAKLVRRHNQEFPFVTRDVALVAYSRDRGARESVMKNSRCYVPCCLTYNYLHVRSCVIFFMLLYSHVMLRPRCVGNHVPLFSVFGFSSHMQCSKHFFFYCTALNLPYRSFLIASSSTLMQLIQQARSFRTGSCTFNK